MAFMFVVIGYVNGARGVYFESYGGGWYKNDSS